MLRPFFHKTARPRVTRWSQFERVVRANTSKLLQALDEFPDSILVSGCQRSGTTALAELINQSDGMTRYWSREDPELAGALILSGFVNHVPTGRYCFQTTYLNSSFSEYFEHDQYKLIWILRNPFSVVYSMLHNWRRGALNRLFRGCGAHLLQGAARQRYGRYGPFAIGRLLKACLSFNGKTLQLFELVERMERRRLMLFDYDDLVTRTHEVLPQIYTFVGLEYKPAYADVIHPTSIAKRKKLSHREAKLVDEVCLPVYNQARKFFS